MNPLPDDSLRNRPESIDPIRWAEMDPAIRLRFHEFGNHISRLEGIITGLSLRVPEKPETIPLLQERVNGLATAQATQGVQLTNLGAKLDSKFDKLDEKIEGVESKLNGLALKVAGGTAILTAIVSTIAQIAMNQGAA